MRPLYSNVYVQPINEAQSSSSGMKLATGNLVKGKVIAAGHSVSDILKPGDIVLYDKDKGDKFSHNGIEGIFIDAIQLVSII